MRLALFSLPILLAGCATALPGPAACPPGMQAATIVQGFFGRDSAGREVVGDADWAGFLDAVVTPAFPDGFSVLDTAGQWRGAGGVVARERGKLLMVAVAGPAGPAAARMAPVVAAYRGRFGQDSVLVTTMGSCLVF